MNKYRTKMGFKWYLILLAPIMASLFGYQYKELIIIGITIFCIRLIIHLIYKKQAEKIIEKTCMELANVQSVKQIENIIQIAIGKREALRMHLLQMVSDKMDKLSVTPHQMNKVIANNRLCYYTSSIVIVKKKKKKENNITYYDISNGEKATCYLFENNVEWLQLESHKSIPIRNIIDMKLECGWEILSLIRRGESTPIFLYTSNALIIMKIVEQIQKG